MYVNKATDSTRSSTVAPLNRQRTFNGGGVTVSRQTLN